MLCGRLKLLRVKYYIRYSQLFHVRTQYEKIFIHRNNIPIADKCYCTDKPGAEWQL